MVARRYRLNPQSTEHVARRTFQLSRRPLRVPNWGARRTLVGSSPAESLSSNPLGRSVSHSVQQEEHYADAKHGASPRFSRLNLKREGEQARGRTARARGSIVSSVETAELRGKNGFGNDLVTVRNRRESRDIRSNNDRSRSACRPHPFENMFEGELGPASHHGE
jgi:hypothetical protein